MSTATAPPENCSPERGSVPASALMTITRERWQKVQVEPRPYILLAMFDRAREGHTFITWPKTCQSPDSDQQLTEGEVAWLRLNGYEVNRETHTQRIAVGCTVVVSVEWWIGWAD